ncbi:MAG TPA: sulfur carrier protein ThiS [Ruminiclostridium sp.]|nr:sulfur carrier protein ThiS [Ruminiclostridium sp.]
MNITVNGKVRTLEKPCTLNGLLKSGNIDPKTVVIEQNGEVPDRADWENINISNGDIIEILKFMGGG